MLRSEFFDGVYRERVVAGEIVSEMRMEIAKAKVER